MNNAFSFRFLFLRGSTAATSVLTGLLQTYVFARVLTPELFSLFVLVGALGFTLLLCDLGASKILFVRLRQRHLDGTKDDSAVGQTSAILILYVSLAVVGSFVCLAAMAWLRPESGVQSIQFGLFFLFTALNLAWFALRNITIAVDEYVYFEFLEVARRLCVIGATFSVLLFLPFTNFLILINAAWLVVFTLAGLRLKLREDLTLRFRGMWRSLGDFWRQNGRMLLRSSIYSVTEIYIYNFPYFFVPVFFGLGAPTIILDTTFKVFRAGSIAYSAACDVVVPNHTRAYNNRDYDGMKRAIWIAAVLSAIPTVVASLILLTMGDALFAWLLGPAAVMPYVAPLLILMLFANLLQMLSLSLLVHNGFFREIAFAGTIVAIAMTFGTIFAALAKLSLVQYLWLYTIIYSGGALVFVAFCWRGPIQVLRDAHAGRELRPVVQ
jgi:O-antigen/teichoic acid export membrane protein